MNTIITWEIMHGSVKTARINTRGEAWIFHESLCPYDLYLEEGPDFDIRINNLAGFYHWCASRMLSPDRMYAKEMLNSIGAAQATTDVEWAEIALSYHCLSLTDVYWVREMGEDVTFEQISLYSHTLNEAVVDLSLRGRQMTVTNEELAADLSTGGCFPKAWIQREEGLFLLKGGGEDAVRRELAASRISRCFDYKQVLYEEDFYAGERVTRSRIFTSEKYSIVTRMAFEIYACNHDLDAEKVCLETDPLTYYGMNIIDYLVGNTDRHPENWGFLVDNETSKIVSLHPIMDLNRSFNRYDTLEGAGCQTGFSGRMTQREAAVEAVAHVGLRQLRDVEEAVFEEAPCWREMFTRRLSELRSVERKH